MRCHRLFRPRLSDSHIRHHAALKAPYRFLRQHPLSSPNHWGKYADDLSRFRTLRGNAKRELAGRNRNRKIQRIKKIGAVSRYGLSCSYPNANGLAPVKKILRAWGWYFLISSKAGCQRINRKSCPYWTRLLNVWVKRNCEITAKISAICRGGPMHFTERTWRPHYEASSAQRAEPNGNVQMLHQCF